jgi:hypothetical protein
MIIEEAMEQVVALMRVKLGTTTPEYMYGHIQEVNQRVQLKETDPINRSKKYPLIILRLDTSGSVDGNVTDHTLNMAIVNRTDQKYNAPERLEKVFKPILIPLYELFMQCLGEVGLFTWDGDQEYPPHTETRRYFWGTESGSIKVANIFSDPIDAIEITNLKISSKKKKNC